MAGEFERIAWIERFSGKVAPSRRRGRRILPLGDDAAAWKPPRGHAAVLTVDVQVEGVHFQRNWLSPEALGRRALAVSASDIAAMAAEPAGVLLSMCLPDTLPESFFRSLVRGLVREAAELGLDIFGGNLSRGSLALSITAVGHAPAEKLVQRGGARSGDVIFVTGWPGRAGLGRALLETRQLPRSRGVHACIQSFRRPRARIREALRIAKSLKVHAMVDISDGLAADLGHILDESMKALKGRGRSPTLGAFLDVASLNSLPETQRRPPSSSEEHRRSLDKAPISDLARTMGVDPLVAVLEGGEDYELLFTASEASSREVARCSRSLGIPIRRIGRVEAGKSGIFLSDSAGGVRRWRPKGFDHFR